MTCARTRTFGIASALLVLSTAIASTATATTNASSDPATREVADSFSALVTAEPGNPVNTGTNYRNLLRGPFGDDPHLWGGAYVDGDELVVIYINQTEREAQDALDASQIGPTHAVELAEGGQSLADYDQQMEVIEGVAASSPDIAVYGPQYSESRIAIGVDPDHQAVDAGLQSAGDGLPFDVAYYEADIDAELQRDQGGTSADSVSLTSVVEHPPSRYYMGWPEFGPLRGGGHLSFREAYNVPGGNCSAGFIWRDRDNNISVISAAHCAYQFDDSRTAAFRFHPTTGQPTWFQDVGSVEWSSGGPNGTVAGRRGDVLAIDNTVAGGPMHGSVWTGNGNSQSYRTVSEYQALPENWQGNNLRTSGSSGFAYNPAEVDSTLGESAPDWISAVNQTVNYRSDNQVFTHMTIAEHVNRCTSPGDSGGSVYLNASDGTAIAIGIVSGSQPGPLFINCHVYYTPVTHVVQDYGGGPPYGSPW